MEFLLINHPLDCPICDQGGECELQDLAMGYGSTVSRYDENKRVVPDKDLGPLVSTDDDALHPLHALRPLRQEIAGVEELGTIGRGEHMEITTYVEQRGRLRAVGQHDRPVPGRRADLQAVRLQRAHLGAARRPSRSTCSTRSAATSASTRAARR